MNRILFVSAVVAALVSCAKQPAMNENAWVNDESLSVPIQFAPSALVSTDTKSINYGLITGGTMSNLDVGIVSVAEYESAGAPVEWDRNLEGSILIDNLAVTTSRTGAVVFSPKLYYPFGNKYAYSFYSYYPYRNAEGETAEIVDGAYKITYPLGNTDILWAESKAVEYNDVLGYNAAYCRAVKLGGEDTTYYPKLQYKHFLTALVFKIVGKDADIADYDVKVNGMQLVNTASTATLCIADSKGIGAGVLTGNGNTGTIGFTDLDIAPTATSTELCTILALPSTNYTADITLTVDGANRSTVRIPVGDRLSSYNAGYIYYFTVTINNPQEITIMETGLEEWIPGSNTEEGREI